MLLERILIWLFGPNIVRKKHPKSPVKVTRHTLGDKRTEKSSSQNSTPITNTQPKNLAHRTITNEPSSGKNAWTASIMGKVASEDSSWRALKTRVMERDNYTCVLCGAKTNPTVDHIKELSFGGSNTLNNLRTLCKDCHEQRHGSKFLERGFDADDDYGENYKVSPKMQALNRAMESGNGIGIKYVDRDGLYSERVIHPNKIYKTKYVYVEAFCELDKDDRVFRLSRMRITNSRQNFYDNESNSYTSRPWTGGPWRGPSK